MQPTIEGIAGDSEMKSHDSQDEKNCIDLERYRNLVRTFIDLVITNFYLNLFQMECNETQQSITLKSSFHSDDIRRRCFGLKKLSFWVIISPKTFIGWHNVCSYCVNIIVQRTLSNCTVWRRQTSFAII